MSADRYIGAADVSDWCVSVCVSSVASEAKLLLWWSKIIVCGYAAVSVVALCLCVCVCV